MNLINFTEKTEIRSASVLNSMCANLNISFEDDAVVTFDGKVWLSNNIIFRGVCKIGINVSIDAGCIIDSVMVGAETNIRSYSVLCGCVFGSNNIIGPHCFVRDDTAVGDFCIVGSHVEVARSVLGDHTKISHQAFVGDAHIGAGVIIGAGVVFCNYDGNGKAAASVGRETLVGSGTLIVSPVAIGEGVVIGAGSVVTKDLIDGQKLVQSRSSPPND